MTLPPPPVPYPAWSNPLREMPHAITFAVILAFIAGCALAAIRSWGPADPPDRGMWTEDDLGHRTYRSDPKEGM